MRDEMDVWIAEIIDEDERGEYFIGVYRSKNRALEAANMTAGASLDWRGAPHAGAIAKANDLDRPGLHYSVRPETVR